MITCLSRLNLRELLARIKAAYCAAERLKRRERQSAEATVIEFWVSSA